MTPTHPGFFAFRGTSKMAADENILTWNVSNWITVVLMAAVAFGAIAFAQKYIAARKAL